MSLRALALSLLLALPGQALAAEGPPPASPALSTAESASANFLADVEPLVSAAERAAYLALTRSYQRRAFERWNRLLAEYAPPPLDPAQREALADYVARRKSQLPEAWY